MIERHFPDMPSRIASLPRDGRGYPVPKFVRWFDSGPDFRIIDPEHVKKCVRHHVCWICGEKLGRFMAFVIGPMCVINRISSEPPSHTDCARFAAIACPFLTRPLAKRNERELPEHVTIPGMVPHNPGLSCLWVTHDYSIRKVGDGLLFEIGLPEGVEFYAQGRHANRGEIEAAIEKGMPFLLAEAKKGGIAQINRTMAERERAERLIDQWQPS
jgi:hypothetical protein